LPTIETSHLLPQPSRRSCDQDYATVHVTNSSGFRLRTVSIIAKADVGLGAAARFMYTRGAVAAKMSRKERVAASTRSSNGSPTGAARYQGLTAASAARSAPRKIGRRSRAGV